MSNWTDHETLALPMPAGGTDLRMKATHAEPETKTKTFSWNATNSSILFECRAHGKTTDQRAAKWSDVDRGN